MLSNLRQMENFKLETSDAKIVGMCGYFPQFLHGCSPPHSFGLEKILFSWNLNIPSVLLPCNRLARHWYSRIRIHFPLKKICTLRYSQPRRCMFVCFCFACFSLFDSSCCRFVVSGFLCKEQVGMVSWAFKMPVCY